MFRPLPWLLLPALVGCGVLPFSPGKRVDHVDLGTACLGEPDPWDTATTLTIDADDTVPVTVVFSQCSSGSVEWIDPTCSVDSDGGRIVVTTEVTTRTPNLTTSDCQWIEHDCGTVTLSASDFTLVYGNGKQTFTVPYDGPSLCARNEP